MAKASDKSICHFCLLGQAGPNSLISEEDRARFVRDIAAKPGEIIKADPNTHRALVIREGSGKTETWLRDGRVAVTGFYYPGDIVELPRGSAIAFEAVTRCRVCDVDVAKAEQVLPDCCCMLRRLVDHGMRRIAGGETRLAGFAHLSVAERVVGFLEELAVRPGAINGTPNVVWTPMRREDIANYLGMQPETLSRAYSELARRGVIAVRSRRQVELLRERAGGGHDGDLPAVARGSNNRQTGASSIGDR